MAPHRITVIEGDGIGPEVMAATLRVLRSSGVSLQFDECQAGVAAQRDQGHPLPTETIQRLLENQVGLKGPLVVPRFADVVQRIRAGPIVWDRS